MKIYTTLLISFAALLTFGGCKKEKIEYKPVNWKVGDWAEYDVQYEVKDSTVVKNVEHYKLKFAVTGMDTLRGVSYYWLEMIETHEKGKGVFKMLVPYGYRGKAERMIIKVGEEPATEMPEGLNEEPDATHRPYLYLPVEIEAGRIDEQKVKTPVGEYPTVHANVKDPSGRSESKIEVWVGNNIPVFGLVKQTTSFQESGLSVVVTQKLNLIAMGNNAETSITEEPLKIDLNSLE